MNSRTSPGPRAWQTFHRRGDVLRRVVAAADARRDGVLPMDVPGVSETFNDELDLLAALTLRWHTRLAGQVERALAEEPLDLTEAVEQAWAATAAALPGVRLVVDRYRAEPVDDTMARALAIATAKERHLLAASAGLSGVRLDAASVQIGADLEERARLLHRGVRLESVAPRCGLVARIRAALVA